MQRVTVDKYIKKAHLCMAEIIANSKKKKVVKTVKQLTLVYPNWAGKTYILGGKKMS